MSISDRLVRGILIGASLGAFGSLFNITGNMMVSVAVGGIAGLFAGLTLAGLDRRKKD